MAHDRSTLSLDGVADELTRVRRIYRTCDFEAVVTLVLAVDSPEPFRVFSLEEPTRLVVDVQR